MLKISHLTKIYPGRKSLFSRKQGQKEVVAVSDLNLEIEEGQVFGLLGINGAGKTSIVKMLSTLLEPTSGTALIGGYDIVRQGQQVRQIVNMIAGGERMLYWRLTARENLRYFADLYHLKGALKEQRIAELLDLVGLTEAADKRVEQYSKGMKQRLQIARGLINNPQYIFMDEPTIGLDVAIAREIRGFIKDKLQRTILFTSHYMEEVEELCDVIAILHKGKIMEYGTTSLLKQKYKSGYTFVLSVDTIDEGVENILCRVHEVDGATITRKVIDKGQQITVSAKTDISAELVSAVHGVGRRVLELREIEPSLEDVLITVAQAGVEAEMQKGSAYA